MLVVDVLGNRRVITTHRAILVSPQLERSELHLERVVLEQAADQRVAALEDDLCSLGGLKRTDGAWKQAEDACLGA